MLTPFVPWRRRLRHSRDHRIVRDEEHLWQVIQYIGQNPRQAGLSLEQAPRWLHPDWQAAGWSFQDS